MNNFQIFLQQLFPSKFLLNNNHKNWKKNTDKSLKMNNWELNLLQIYSSNANYNQESRNSTQWI